MNSDLYIPELNGVKIGYAVCGSFCTFEKSFDMAKKLADSGALLTPIMSFNASTISSRFGTAEDNRRKLEEICLHSAITTIEGAEPVGPKKMFDILVVCPCTGNTLAKLAYGIVDTPVTMAVKSHIRNSRPVVLAIATNDALAGCAKNIGTIMNYRNFYFTPMKQDDPKNKPRSAISDFSMLPETIFSALYGNQIQPIYK